MNEFNKFCSKGIPPKNEWKNFSFFEIIIIMLFLYKLKF